MKGEEIVRDMDISSFGEILAELSERIDGIETVVFYDSLGETIDYYSRVEPFMTRLIAAHHGLIFQSAATRLGWLKLGEVEMIEIEAGKKKTFTMRVGEDNFLTAVVTERAAQEDVMTSLRSIAQLLFEEAGF